jgi:hypothetical protein
MKHLFSVFLLVVAINTLQAQPGRRFAPTTALNYDWREGFVSITELTAAAGLSVTESAMSAYYYGITSVAGWQFSRNLKAGGGAGLHIHNEGILLPLFLDFRLNFNARELVPFVAGTGGVTIDPSDINASRVFINPSAGLRYVVANRKAITFSTGIMLLAGSAYDRKSFLNVRIGMEFKKR